MPLPPLVPLPSLSLPLLQHPLPFQPPPPPRAPMVDQAKVARFFKPQLGPTAHQLLTRELIDQVAQYKNEALSTICATMLAIVEAPDESPSTREPDAIALLLNGCAGRGPELAINGQGRSAGAAVELAKWLRTNRTITKLNVWSNRFLNEGACAIATALTLNSTLRELNLSWNNIGYEGACALATALTQNSTIQVLILDSNQISELGAIAFAAALTKNRTLKTLDLCTNRIYSEGACALAAALLENRTLTELNLNVNFSNDDGVCAFAGSLKSCALEVLKISDNCFGIEGMSALAAVLLLNTTLKTLDLFMNELGDKEACILADVLPMNHTLQELDLSYNQIGDEGACALADALEQNRTLKTLSIERNRIGIKGARIFALLPQNRDRQSLLLSCIVVATAGRGPLNRSPPSIEEDQALFTSDQLDERLLFLAATSPTPLLDPLDVDDLDPFDTGTSTWQSDNF
eukprot:GAFH01001479.1.p1 GENE.GAFH01001479.1~~GAFH01001479.1.p1  ORF type:complete len:497 (-),score=62.62 GAFH01001479.1:115-1503(-)